VTGAAIGRSRISSWRGRRGRGGRGQQPGADGVGVGAAPAHRCLPDWPWTVDRGTGSSLAETRCGEFGPKGRVCLTFHVRTGPKEHTLQCVLLGLERSLGAKSLSSNSDSLLRVAE
jgi:hypothetical protein